MAQNDIVKKALTWLGSSIILVCLLGITVPYLQSNQTLDLPPPTWHEITPARTSAAEVIQRLGKPDRVDCSDDEMRMVYDWSDLDLRGSLFWTCLPGQMVNVYLAEPSPQYLTKVLLRSEKVWAIKVSIMSREIQSYLGDYIRQYGNPDRVGWSKLNLGSRVVVFARRGILVHVTSAIDADQARVFQTTYFAPRTVESTSAAFAADMSLDGPERLKIADNDYGQMDPWGFNKQEHSRLIQ